MSYVQGTEVRLQADFRDTNTNEPFDPPDVLLTVVPPTDPPFTATLVDGEVMNDASRVGRFFYVLDTSAEPGTWRYQFENLGGGRTVQRKEITVTKRLTA
jgi:hypothetical protein